MSPASNIVGETGRQPSQFERLCHVGFAAWIGVMPVEVPPQPEADAPAPPPARQARRSWWIAGLILILAIVAAIYGWKKIEGRRHAATETMVFSHMKSLSVALFEFDTEYGSYPTDDTQADVCAATGAMPWPSVTSNDLFRQLIVQGLRSEILFSDFGASGWTRRPDDIMSPFSKALEPGECAFGYVPGSRFGDPGRPLLLYPMVPGTRLFDPKPLGGKATILRVDGSMRAFDIDSAGRVQDRGKHLFDPSQPYWGGLPPDVRSPAR